MDEGTAPLQFRAFSRLFFLPFPPLSGNIKNHLNFKHLLITGLNIEGPRGGLMTIFSIIIHKFNKINTLNDRYFGYCAIQKKAYRENTEDSILNMPPSV